MSIYFDPADPTEKVPIPIMYRANDPILHDEAHPFCDDMSCECHNRRIAENQEAFEHCIGNPLMAGLLTVDEAQRLYHGTQV